MVDDYQAQEMAYGWASSLQQLDQTLRFVTAHQQELESVLSLPQNYACLQSSAFGQALESGGKRVQGWV